VATPELLLTDRVGRLRARIAQEGLDGLIVSAPASVFWLTGYTGTNGLCLITPSERVFLTDARYAGNLAQLPAEWDVRIVEVDLIGVVAGDVAGLLPGVSRLGFEAARMTYHDWQRLDEGAGGALELVAAKGLLEDVRARKSPDEIASIRQGAEINDQIYAWLAEQGIDGKAEADIARAVADRMRDLGATGQAFPTIVGGGANGASPHHVSGADEVGRNTLVVIDLGAVVGGYNSDCTRTFAIGHTDDQMREVYEVVLRAQEAALALVRPGTRCIDVHETARRVIVEAGYGEFFNHGTGHGVGVEIHEEPRFRAGFGGVLEAGNVVTVEPGVYLPDRFGVRIEDLVAVTEDGHEVLSRFPKSLLDIG
jgi:Xaa-Pro aminopeptidase